MGLRLTFLWSALTALSLSYGWSGLVYGASWYPETTEAPHPVVHVADKVDRGLDYIGQLLGDWYNGLDQKSCADGSQVDASMWCDGQVNCYDGSDEWAQNCQTPASDFQDCVDICDGGKTCVKELQLCNGHEDCQDGSDEDEAKCAAVKCPRDDQFRCRREGTGWTCFDESAKCSVVHECLTEVANSYDCYKETCPVEHRSKGYFHCNATASNWCIDMKFACDGVKHCPNGEDEESWECGSVQCKEHKCGKDQVCKLNDGVPECYCRPGMKERHYFARYLRDEPCVDINECASPERYCSHGCLNREDERMYECTCDGFGGSQLAPDGQGCHRASPYTLFYVVRNQFYLAAHWFNAAETRAQRGAETHLSYIEDLKQNPSSMAYDLLTGRLYYVDRSDGHRSKVKMVVLKNREKPKMLPLRGDFSVHPMAIAVDGAASNLYISDMKLRHIVVCSVQTEKRLFCLPLIHGVNVTAMVVHDGHGRLLYADRKANQSAIYAANLNGTSVRLVHESKTLVTSVAYDYPLNYGMEYFGVVYWSTMSANDGKGAVERSTLEGDRHQVLIPGLYKATSIAVHENQIYVASTSLGLLSLTTIGVYRKTDGVDTFTCSLLNFINKEFYYELGPIFLSNYGYEMMTAPSALSHRCRSYPCEQLCLPSGSGDPCVCQMEFHKLGNKCVRDWAAPVAGVPAPVQPLPHPDVTPTASPLPVCAPCGSSCIASCHCAQSYVGYTITQNADTYCHFVFKSKEQGTTVEPTAAVHCAPTNLDDCKRSAHLKSLQHLAEFECRVNEQRDVDRKCHCSDGFIAVDHGPMNEGTHHHWYLCYKVDNTTRLPQSTTVSTTTTAAATSTTSSATPSRGPRCFQLAARDCTSMGYRDSAKYMCLEPSDQRQPNCKCPPGYVVFEQYEVVVREYRTICIREHAIRPKFSPQCDLLAELCQRRTECKCTARSMKKCRRLDHFKHFDVSYDHNGVCSYSYTSQCVYDPHKRRPSPCSQICADDRANYECSCVPGYDIHGDNVCVAQGAKFLLTSTPHGIQLHNISLGLNAGYEEWDSLTNYDGDGHGPINHFVYDPERKIIIRAEAVFANDQWKIVVRASPFDVSSPNASDPIDVEVIQLQEFVQHSMTYDPVTGVVYIFSHDSVLACDFHLETWCANLTNAHPSALMGSPKVINARDRTILWLGNSALWQASLDFTNATEIPSALGEFTNGASAIDLDLTQDRIYVASGGVIVSVKLDGTQLVKYDVGFRISHLAVFENAIYISSGQSVFRLDKAVGPDDSLPEPHKLFHHHEIFTDLAVTADVLSSSEVSNPCASLPCELTESICLQSTVNYTCVPLLPEPTALSAELNQSPPTPKTNRGTIATFAVLILMAFVMGIVYMRKKGRRIGPNMSLRDLRSQKLSRRLSGIGVMFRHRFDSGARRRILVSDDMAPNFGGSGLGSGIENPAYLEHHQPSPSPVGPETSLFPSDHVFAEGPQSDSLVSAIADIDSPSGPLIQAPDHEPASKSSSPSAQPKY